MCMHEPVQVSGASHQLMVARASLLKLYDVVAKHNEAIGALTR